MTLKPHKPDSSEQEMLEHYRRYSTDQPSPALDKQILEAASAQAGKGKPSLGERLQHWLASHGGRQRWSVALAGLATLGIGLSLTMRIQEQALEQFGAPPAQVSPIAAPAPMTKAAPATYASPPVQAEKKASAMADSVDETARQQAESASMQEASKTAGASSPLADPTASLRQVLALRQAGKREEAAKLLDDLMARYPQRDIAGELRELTRGRE
ncbi:hypothetical protein [Metapseudomonas boanensis]|uniref:Tetratricopeptide repeat protein n=1 Tax=Metapseudomonas boanensis TaxID=2822138 RepID=A0ABS5XKX4_9GAMM|nr:hypothetical protein [Pseudomonas boanensis]MBT8768343.1 hypothetical protein [Pseudomonas boanensis]